MRRAMESEVRNVLHVAPDVFWARLFFDAGYTEKLYEALEFDRYEVLSERREDNGDVKRVVRGFPPLNAPGIIKRRLGAKLHYDEDGTFDAGRGVWSFRTVPSVVPDQVHIGGEIQLEPHPQGCTHVVRMRTKVTAWGLGPLVERIIDRNTRSSYATFTQFTNAYAAEHGLTVG